MPQPARTRSRSAPREGADLNLSPVPMPAPEMDSGPEGQAPDDPRAEADDRRQREPENEREPGAEPPDSSEEWSDPGASRRARRASMARHASGRRRLIDPTTCDRDYSEEEIEFMKAMQSYKQRSGRMFPTWSEVLEVLRSLGYSKPEEAAGPPDG